MKNERHVFLFAMLSGMAVLMFTVFAHAAEIKLNEIDAWAAAQAEWGQDASPQNVRLLHDDVTCDGVPDYVASYVDLNDPEGESFGVMIVTSHSGKAEHLGVSFPYGGKTVYRLLHNMPNAFDPPKVSMEEWDADELAQTIGQQEACLRAIKIDDGLSDKLNIFWNPAATGTTNRFFVYRN